VYFHRNHAYLILSGRTLDFHSVRIERPSEIDGMTGVRLDFQTVGRAFCLLYLRDREDVEALIRGLQSAIALPESTEATRAEGGS